MLPFGRLWYGGPNAAAHAIGYAMHGSRSHDAVIRVYDEAGNVIETHERARASDAAKSTQSTSAPNREITYLQGSSDQYVFGDITKSSECAMVTKPSRTDLRRHENTDQTCRSAA